jgi:DNA processing protein
VGSRAARPAAIEVSTSLATDLARCGLVVVSGRARGVDAAAHPGALATGHTAAVLGTGIDVVYPAAHGALADAVARAGALVSEFLPGTPPRAHHFPLRNRILSGLVRAVVVIEASERSGSLITARLAAEQGREVMVVPGDVRGGANRGGHALLRDGARLVEQAVDVLDELGWDARPARPNAGSDADGRHAVVPPVIDLLRRTGGLPLDELSERLGASPPLLLRDLLDFELAGLVVRDGTGQFLPAERKW